MTAPRFTHLRAEGGRGRLYLVSLTLASAILIAFAPALNNGFIDFDDDVYLTNNEGVKGGLTAEAVHWAFIGSFGYTSNWHPITWLSHQADVQFFGLNPRWHHLTGMLIHAASAVLLLLILTRLTGSFWASSVAAFLFALHPLRVESVAWAAERKDVLAVFFWMTSLWAYASYVRRPNPTRYLLIVASLALGLMSKALNVTLPAALLLLDYWPLGRFGPARGTTPSGPSPGRFILEKVPLALLAAASSAATLLAQDAGGALRTFARYPLLLRLANATVSTAAYLWKTVWPDRLAVFYPYPPAIPAWKVLAAGGILGAVTVMPLLRRRQQPFLAVGWLWYLVTLAPMSGVVQVGSQSMADRYTYLPSIGLALMAGWGLAEIAGGKRGWGLAVAAAVTAVTVLLGFLTWAQTGYWRNTGTLFSHALAVTSGNWIAYNNYGKWLGDQGLQEEALSYFKESIRFNPRYATAWYNLGATLIVLKRLSEAEPPLQKALQERPIFPEAEYNLAYSLFWQGKMDEAIIHYQAALRQKPDFPEAQRELVKALKYRGFGHRP